MNFPPPTERQARLIWLALSGLAVAVLAGLVALLVWGLGQVLQLLSPVLWPLAVAGILAYLLDPIVDYLAARGLRRSRAILCVFGLALVLMVALVGNIVPPLVSETRELAARVPAYASRLEERAVDWVNHPPPLLRWLLERRTEHNRHAAAGEGAGAGAAPAGTNSHSATATNSPPGAESGSGSSAAGSTPEPPLLTGELAPPALLHQATGWLASIVPHLGPWLSGQVGRVFSWFGVLAGLALVPVYAFYFLLEKHPISSRWTDYLPVADSNFKRELVFVLRSINDNLITFFRGQVLVALCDGALYGLGFLLIGLPYGLLLGVMAVFLTMIPYLGALVICVTALLIAAVQFGDWTHPLMVLGVFSCVQVLESMVVSPKIMAGRVGLHPVTIIIAVMTGTTLLGGLLGGILAIPLTAALRVVMFRYIWKRRPAERRAEPRGMRQQL
jgi:predicted PurR-regulated permease PerM